MMKALGIVVLALCAMTSWAKDTWHEGHIVYKHTLDGTQHGVVPPGTHILLDTGDDIDVSQLPADDVLHKLIDYWSRERTDYRAAPPNVDTFIYRLHGKQPQSGIAIEVRYSANGFYGRDWSGITQKVHGERP